ncbi:MAG: 16S rRNA (guanine(527)-N(7))-methyltransferase RsmG [Rhizobiaceae bacterium]|nr:16S rRNA (guanine(527)-N(7))-methyltransferase RsmG [Rhizobiaceae bacterium]
MIGDVKSVSRETQQRLTDFHDLLVQWQARINLIAPSTVNQIWQRHIFDSLQICEVLEDAETVVDIGSGAGFPGLVIAMMLAEKGAGKVHLVESNGKKCAFMNAVIRKTGLREAGVDVQVVNDRIENALPHLAAPDVITARALAPLNELLTLTQGFLSSGAIGVFPKGRGHAEEIKHAREHWEFDIVQSDSQLEDGSVILKISALRAR